MLRNLNSNSCTDHNNTRASSAQHTVQYVPNQETTDYPLKLDVYDYKTVVYCAVIIDIERKNRLLKVCYVPATSAAFLAFFSFFLLWPLTVLMKQTSRAVRAIKQSILLRCQVCYVVIMLQLFVLLVLLLLCCGYGIL